jgi:phage regulator Rha-like protein
MSDLIVTNIDGQLLVDSRLIAERLGVKHKATIQLIRANVNDLKEFGHLAFEMEGVRNSVGAVNQEVFCLLNEDQATYLMTLSKNTPQVKLCKKELVSAFSKAKAIISTIIPAQSDRIRELELENENLRLKSDIATLHGKEFAAMAIGGGVIRVEVPVTEIVEPATDKRVKILTATQLKEIVKRRTGQNLPSLKWFADELRTMGRDDLLVPVTRSATSEYPIPEKLDEAIALIYGKTRQTLIGEHG